MARDNRPPIKPGKRTPGGLPPIGTAPDDVPIPLGRAKKGRAGTKVRIGGGPNSHPTGPRLAQRGFTVRSDMAQRATTKHFSGSDSRLTRAAKAAKRPTRAQSEIKGALAVRKAVQAGAARRSKGSPKSYSGSHPITTGVKFPSR